MESEAEVAMLPTVSADALATLAATGEGEGAALQSAGLSCTHCLSSYLFLLPSLTVPLCSLVLLALLLQRSWLKLAVSRHGVTHGEHNCVRVALSGSIVAKEGDIKAAQDWYVKSAMTTRSE